MCLLLAVRNEGASRLWVGANRDEHVARPWRPPALLVTDPPVLGGLDVEGGGSWLAVNLQAGFVVGVTNARLGARPGRRSRGQLVLDAAMQPSLPAAVALLTEVDADSYGAFNLLLVDAAAAYVATNYPSQRLDLLDDALIALGNELLGGGGGRTAAALQALEPALGGGDAEMPTALARLLADHRGADPFCRHFGPFGTVSSTICELRDGRLTSYLFAPGPPCRTPFAPVPIPEVPYS